MQRSILVDVGDFRIDVTEDGQVVRRITDFAVGRDGYHTPMTATGLSQDRERLHISGHFPPPHGGASMPFTLFFNDGSGCAFHQGNTSVASHGCIHLSATDAPWLFQWSGADPVSLGFNGSYPANPVSAKLYGLGAANMCGAVISDIQGALSRAGDDPATSGGVFDQATDAAVRSFQAAHGLAVDGKVGPHTAAALGIAL